MSKKSIGHDNKLHQIEVAIQELSRRIDELRFSRGSASVGHTSEKGVADLDNGELVCRISATASREYVRKPNPPLPDPALIRRIIKNRRLRAEIFGDGLFGEPAWDMLLDLCASSVEHKRVSVTSLCIASGVPPTTALRWINVLVEEGIFVRIDDKVDRRRSYVDLTDKGRNLAARYFASIAPISNLYLG